MPPLTLKQLLIESFDIPITLRQAQEAVKYVLRYEVRGENMMAFNTPMLAIHKAYFLPKDADGIFSLFNVYKPDFVRTIKKCTGINTSFNVTGNEFNLLIIWLVYLLNKSTLAQKVKYETQVALLKLLHYKFFTGKVATMFKHGANEGVMQYTIDNLSAKCDIKHTETNTWRLLIQDHVVKLLDKSSIHYNTLQNFTDDKAVIYVLSDAHTRLSTKIVNVAEEYYKNHAAGNSIGSTSLMATSEDGEKKLQAMKITLDNCINNVQNAVLNLSSFLNANDIKLAAGIANIRPEILREVLMAFSAVATDQYKARTGDEIKTDKQKNKLYVGYRVLIQELIQKTYRRCAAVGCDMRSNVQILEKARDAYRASRILDVDILTVKNSIDYFITEHTKYTREATQVAARTAFVMYIMIMSFKHN